MTKAVDQGDGDPGESIGSLRDQLAKDPRNQVLRLRLVRALHSAGDKQEFQRESARYRQIELDSLERLAVGDAQTAGHASTGREKIRRFANDPSAAQPLAELADAYANLRVDPKYLVQLDLELARQGGRPTPLVHAARLSESAGGAQIYFKYEFASGADAHLSIAANGQVHLARCLGRKRVVAGVRDVKWGLYLASACARFGLQCEVFLDKGLHDQQAAPVFQMRLMGATVTVVDTRNYRGGDVREAGLEAWIRRSRENFLFLGLDSGPRPYPEVARDNTAVIGRECRRQMAALTRRPPDLVVVRGGDNTDAIGLLPAFLEDKRVRLVCVEPAPEGPRKPGDRYDPFHALPTRGEEKRMQALLGGMEYVSVARENTELRASGRVEDASFGKGPALKALRETARLEGLVIGLQTSHALGWALERARKMSIEETIVVLLKERGEKDLWDVMRLEGDTGG